MKYFKNYVFGLSVAFCAQCAFSSSQMKANKESFGFQLYSTKDLKAARQLAHKLKKLKKIQIFETGRIGNQRYVVVYDQFQKNPQSKSFVKAHADLLYTQHAKIVPLQGRKRVIAETQTRPVYGLELFATNNYDYANQFAEKFNLHKYYDIYQTNKGSFDLYHVIYGTEQSANNKSSLLISKPNNITKFNPKLVILRQSKLMSEIPTTKPLYGFEIYRNSNFGKVNQYRMNLGERNSSQIYTFGKSKKNQYQLVYGKVFTLLNAKTDWDVDFKKIQAYNPTIISLKNARRYCPPKIYHFTVNSGSMYTNIKRYSKQFNYKLLWKVRNPVSGAKADLIISDSSNLKSKFPISILKKITTPYPIQVVVWNKNRVICVTNNNSCA